MRGMLVDQHQTVGSLGDDIGVGHLPARDAEGIGLRFGRDGRGFLGAAHGQGARLCLWRVPVRPRLADTRLLCGPVAPGEHAFEQRRHRSTAMCDRLAHPPPHRRAVGPLGTPPVAGRQRLPQPRDDETAHPCAIAETHLGLGRVHVDVDILRRQFEKQREHRVAIARQHVGIGPAHRAHQQPVFHRAAIDE
jgi:hypothetical protein